MIENRHCPGCGESGSVTEMRSGTAAEDLTFDELVPFWSGLFKEKVFFSYARCKTCALLFAPRFFTQEQLSTLYADMLANMPDVPEPSREATQRDYWRIIERAGVRGGGYMELGPDTGWIVRHAAEAGRFAKFWLFEPNRAVHPALKDACGKQPRLISTQMEDFSAVPDGSISAAVLVHVLDHLLDPLAVLTQVRRKLMPGGVLLAVTHNEQSVLRTLMGRKFPPFCLQHPELYNPATISNLLQRAGFVRTAVERTRSYFPIGFMLRQATWTFGVDVARLPLPEAAVGLRLGNIAATATVA